MVDEVGYKERKWKCVEWNFQPSMVESSSLASDSVSECSIDDGGMTVGDIVPVTETGLSQKAIFEFGKRKST